MRLALKPLATVHVPEASDEPRQKRGLFFILPSLRLAATMRAFVLPNPSGKGAANGLVAQSVEQRIENPCVGGSIPPQATKFKKRAPMCFLKTMQMVTMRE